MIAVVSGHKRWILERKLAAILSADVCGYSRLMGDNEEATLHRLTSHRKLIDSAIDHHHGDPSRKACVLAAFFGAIP